MKISLSRTWMLRATVILIILAILPGAIRRILDGDLYLFTERFWGDLSDGFKAQARAVYRPTGRCGLARLMRRREGRAGKRAWFFLRACLPRKASTGDVPGTPSYPQEILSPLLSFRT